MNFTSRPNARCQRGLRYDLEFEGDIDGEALVNELQQAFDQRLVRADERWGDHLVIRLVLQFRFELRIGERPRQLGLLYRQTCSAAEKRRLWGQLQEVFGAAG